jgi:hypothetical protein
MPRVSRSLEYFRFEDERRQLEVLDDAHDKSGRDSGKERGENNSPDHETLPLVAGKADGVARVMRRIVQPVGMGKPDAENQNAAKQERRNPSRKALRNRQ